MIPSYFQAALLIVLTSSFSCNSIEKPQNQDGKPTNAAPIPPAIGFSVVKTYPHDETYFTEGLEFHEGRLLESSGGNNDESPFPSAAGIADLRTGKVDTRVNLDTRTYFGEGITVFGNTLYQLTWKNGIAFTYDIHTFKKTGELRIPTPEGWGLTHDTASLIMSDGSSNLYFLNPGTLQIKYTLSVIDNTGPVGNLNELEYVNGSIYANRWQTPYILRIDATTGKVTGMIDLTGIVNETHAAHAAVDVLNGIAYQPKSGTFFVTGKKWPLIYEIRLQ